MRITPPAILTSVPPLVSQACIHAAPTAEETMPIAREASIYKFPMVDTDFDSAGTRLNAAKRYTVTFAKGETPPVNGFWSLTLYNKEHLFEPNKLNRFSLGTKSKSMKPNADGSLTIYAQHESPGPDRESNWLPAPADEFSLYIRAYWPKAEILEGKWTPPQVLEAK